MMCRSMLATFFAITVGVSVANSQVPDWYEKLKTFSPRISRRAEVEKIFESPRILSSYTFEGIESVYYEVNDGRFTVEYFSGVCHPNRSYLCQLKKDTAIDIRFVLKTPIKLSRLKLNLREMEFYRENDNPTEHYVDRSVAIGYGVQMGRVRSVHVFHPSMFESVKRLNQTGEIGS
jgi:hypothetical protein